MEKRIKFNTPIDSTNPDYAYTRIISYFFTVIDSSLIGTRDEKSETKQHRIIVEISLQLQDQWKVPENELIKVFFEFVLEHVEKKVRTRSLRTKEKIVLNCDNSVFDYQYDPSMLKTPDGFEIRVEEEHPKIGFH